MGGPLNDHFSKLSLLRGYLKTWYLSPRSCDSRGRETSARRSTSPKRECRKTPSEETFVLEGPRMFWNSHEPHFNL